MRTRYSRLVRTDPPMPFLKLDLIRGDKFVRTEGLLDSGSSASIFPAEFAEDIGIDFAAGNPERFVTAAGDEFEAYQHRVNVHVGRHIIRNALIGFTPSINPKYGLLGQDFFRFFRIRFIASQMMVRLTRESK